ncbi:hypothetical protein QWZ02_09335 [Kinneretia asaccharophila]|uniref:Uncharacterized protein n=1 Tax=Roseateles asaccharophilus TaxID=582607 RepID=A0A4R6N3W2_9BURK|nr:hypothetical protein [Roseateles asaccharophilus]MDN3544649.1 hypothetical protein [Roseateles asaccharophilus]TDP09585.1 hypothetical protein DFR39_104146 [Roseateles asaccharophilus]
MSRREIPDLPEGWLIALVAVLVFILFVLSLLVYPPNARAAEPIKAGAVCTVPDAWYSVPNTQPQATAPQAVRVVLLAPIPATNEPGAWIEPTTGPRAGYQFLIQAERLKECKA